MLCIGLQIFYLSECGCDGVEAASRRLQRDPDFWAETLQGTRGPRTLLAHAKIQQIRTSFSLTALFL